MKNYKNFSIYDFSDYAEEITGDELFKINGGAEVENSHEGVAGAKPGDTITRNDGTVVVLNQGDINYANEQLGKKANTETGSENKPDLISNDYGESASQTTDSIPDVPEEIKSNSHALAYYMAKQGQAIAEGNTDRYKGYNVLGSGIKTKELKADSMNNETNVNYTNSYKFDFWKEVEDCFDFKIGLRADFQVKIRNNINVGGSINIASIDTEYEPDFYTSGLEGFLAIGNDTVNLIELGGKFEKIAYGSCAFALLEYGTEYEFTPYANYNTKGDVSFTAGIGFVATIHINEILDLGLKSMRSMGFE